MKVYAPKYYEDFKCTGGECKHNCCIGWEIDIDSESYRMYMEEEGELGVRLRENICHGVQPHFNLTEDNRCPFLNSDNLCDLILEKGEDMLCEICHMHPRFLNFYEQCEEVGVGLCCEAAAELILEGGAAETVLYKDGEGELSDEEEALFTLRDNINDILMNDWKSFGEKVKEIIEKYKIILPDRTHKMWADEYLKLERLDEKWTHILLESDELDKKITNETALEGILSYFIFRYLPPALYDGYIKERIAFCIHATLFIAYVSLAIDEPDEYARIKEAARLYSSEIEYSEENIEKLISYFDIQDY